MLKKITLAAVAAVLLIGSANLFARETKKKPQAKPGQQQKAQAEKIRVQKQKAQAEKIRAQKQKAQAEKIRAQKQKADQKLGPKRAEALQRQRRQEAAKKTAALQKKRQPAAKRTQPVRNKQQRAGAKRNQPLQKQRQEAARRAEAQRRVRMQAAARRSAPGARPDSRVQQARPGLYQAGPQMLSRWLDELTQAYRANDREKMGLLIKKMHEVRQRIQRVRSAQGQLWRGAAPRWRAPQHRDIDAPSHRGTPERSVKPAPHEVPHADVHKPEQRQHKRLSAGAKKPQGSPPRRPAPKR